MIFIMCTFCLLLFFFPKQIDEIVSATQNISVDINSWVLLWGKKFQSRTKKLFQSFQHQCQPLLHMTGVLC